MYMKCQRQITKICWQDHIRNSEVAARTGLGPVSDLITHRQNSVFGHIAGRTVWNSLSEDVRDLECSVDGYRQSLKTVLFFIFAVLVCSAH